MAPAALHQSRIRGTTNRDGLGQHTAHAARMGPASVWPALSSPSSRPALTIRATGPSSGPNPPARPPAPAPAPPGPPGMNRPQPMGPPGIPPPPAPAGAPRPAQAPPPQLRPMPPTFPNQAPPPPPPPPPGFQQPARPAQPSQQPAVRPAAPQPPVLRPGPPQGPPILQPTMPGAPPGNPVLQPTRPGAPGGPPMLQPTMPGGAPGQVAPTPPVLRPAMPGAPAPAPGGPAAAGAAPPTLIRPVKPAPPPSRARAPRPVPSYPNANSNGAPALIPPNPPPLRVLEPLIRQDIALLEKQQQQQQQAANNGKAPAVEEEDDEEAEFDEDADNKKGKKKGGKGRKQKVTAEMRRAARKAREEKREEKAAALRKEREEIFEVGEEGMSLEQLAEIIQVDASEIVKSLFMKGISLSMNQVLDKNTCKLVGGEYGLLVVDKAEEDVTAQAKKRREFVTDEDIDDLEPRPPVVTVMGHVDHGKTSLLDYIRKARVAAGEAGGITQGIGAYNTSVEVDGEEKTVCFLDTPGHEAFSAMRARGAQVTDVAIVIVAADDGVRPQTKEAVAHAQAAGVPILVAINKVDKPGADVERVKQELLELNLVAEEWGGNTPMVAVSAKKGTGIPDLLQMVSWMAEEKQLMANAKKPAQGTVIEAHLDKKIGPVATLLVQAGTLKVGDIVSAGASYGKVRSLRDDLGKSMDKAGPSIAVQLYGLNSTPVAGEEWSVAANEAAAREAAEKSLLKFKAQRLAEMTGGGSMVTLSSLATIDEEMEAIQKLNLIIKGDTVGVVEAIKSALSGLPQQSITLRYLLSAAGDISVSDVDLAAASGGLVLGFNLSPDVTVEEHAKRLGVKIMTYKVIYDLIDDVKAAMEGKLRSVQERVNLGKAEVKALFGTGKKKVAGCAVTEGKLQKNAYVLVKRGKATVFEGKLSSLRRVKDLVDEVKEGFECGVGCEDFLEWAVGDSIECYQMVTKSRKLEDARASMAVDVSTLVA